MNDMQSKSQETHGNSGISVFLLDDTDKRSTAVLTYFLDIFLSEQ